jgi:hypothetical protein
MTVDTSEHLKIRVFNEDNGHEIVLEGRPSDTVGHMIEEMYVRLHVQRQPDDRLRCQEGGADVLQFAHLTLHHYLEAGHCRCLVWLFAGSTGGAACQ